MFDYDWFHGRALALQIEAAKFRCALKKFPELDPETARNDAQFKAFYDALEARVLLYLRDGFSYELKELAQLEIKAHLTFECEPVDEHYKVGSFLVSVPYEDIVRVEVYAVHPSEKPEDVPMITGFRSGPPEGPGPSRDEHHRAER